MHRASKAGKKRSFNRYWLRLNISPLLANMTHRALPDAYVTAIFRELLVDGQLRPCEPLVFAEAHTGEQDRLLGPHDQVVDTGELQKFTANHYRTT